MIGGELLRKVTESMGYVISWPGRRHEVKHPDYAQLGRAYEEKPFVAQACDVSSAFLFAGGFRLKIGDRGPGTEDGRTEERRAEAEQELNRFFAANQPALWQAAIDSALYRTAYLVLEYDAEREQVVMRVEPPDGIKAMPRKLAPWKSEGFKIRVELDEGTWEQTITERENVIKAPGTAAVRTANPYGLVPVVEIAEKRRSGKSAGKGVITDQVYDLCDMYGELRASAFEGESYHGNPVPWVRGLKDSTAMRTAIEDGDWGSGQMIELTEKGEAGFLETSRGCEGAREQMKMTFYGIVAETGIPEYVWGVHMQSAQASTKEQKDAIERHANGRRMWWGPALCEAARIALRIMGYHGLTQMDTDADIEVEWGPVIQPDAKAEAETKLVRVQAVEGLQAMGAISTDSSRRLFPEEIPNPEEEKAKVEAEREELSELRDEGRSQNAEGRSQKDGAEGEEEES